MAASKGWASRENPHRGGVAPSYNGADCSKSLPVTGWV